jgi:hypothetical protein
VPVGTTSGLRWRVTVLKTDTPHHPCAADNTGGKNFDCPFCDQAAVSDDVSTRTPTPMVDDTASLRR